MNYIKKIESEIKGKTLYEQLNIIRKYVIIDNPCEYKSGIYLIEDFYVGKSTNIISRISAHILEVINSKNAKVVHNKEKLYLIQSILKNRKLKVKVIDEGLSKEVFHIERLYSILPLTNIEFVTKGMSTKKQKFICSKIKDEKVNVVYEKFNKYWVAKTTIKNKVYFKIAKTQKQAEELLKNYFKLKIGSVKEKKKKVNKTEDYKKITEFKYIAVRSKYVKMLFLQEEKWREKLEQTKNYTVVGFDDADLARCWLKRSNR
jgi:hypothetical protein